MVKGLNLDAFAGDIIAVRTSDSAPKSFFILSGKKNDLGEGFLGLKPLCLRHAALYFIIMKKHLRFGTPDLVRARSAVYYLCL